MSSTAGDGGWAVNKWWLTTAGTMVTCPYCGIMYVEGTSHVCAATLLTVGARVDDLDVRMRDVEGSIASLEHTLADKEDCGLQERIELTERVDALESNEAAAVAEAEERGWQRAVKEMREKIDRALSFSRRMEGKAERFGKEESYYAGCTMAEVLLRDYVDDMAKRGSGGSSSEGRE